MESDIKEFIEKHPSFSTVEFADMLRTRTPGIARSTIYHSLKVLCNTGAITRNRRGYFYSTAKNQYYYELSDTAKELSAAIHKSYPLVDFQIWELYQMNEFVNHLLAKNTIFIEAENMLDESIFNILFSKYPHVLLNPSIDEYYKYSGEETIVVQRLISEAPPSIGEYKQASLEKILVDLFGRGLSGKIISRSEYCAILEDSFKKYNINQAKMFRYARRRGNEKAIRKYIEENTYINLEEVK